MFVGLEEAAFVGVGMAASSPSPGEWLGAISSTSEPAEDGTGAAFSGVSFGEHAPRIMISVKIRINRFFILSPLMVG